MQPLTRVPPSDKTPQREAAYPHLITVQPPPFLLTAECIDYTVNILITLWLQPDGRGQTKKGEWQNVLDALAPF